MTDQAVRAVFAKHANGVDETIVDYVCSVLESDHSEDSMEMIEGMLDGALDDGDVAELCKRLLDAVNNVKGEATVDDDLPKKLEKPVVMDHNKEMKAATFVGEDFGRGVRYVKDTIEFNPTPATRKKMMRQVRRLQLTAQRRRKQLERTLYQPKLPKKRHPGGPDGETEGFMPNNIRMEHITLSYDGLSLLDDGTLTIVAGHKYGVVGRNGVGKSTLMRAIAGRDVHMPPGVEMLLVEQEVEASEVTALDCVLQCDSERWDLLEEEKAIVDYLDRWQGEGEGDADTQPATKPEPVSKADEKPKGCDSEANGCDNADDDKGSDDAENPEGDDDEGDDTPPTAEELGAAAMRLKEIYDRLEVISADKAKPRAASILNGLQFTPDMQSRPCSSFSGGWRMRIALACALFCEPDILLLDEPTNHLDLHAVLWLEDYLHAYENTVIIVSHTREFLNRVVTDIVHFFNHELAQYPGDYDTFEKARYEKQLNLERAHEAQEMRRKHIQKFIDRFRYKAARAALVQSRIKTLEKMEKLPPLDDDPSFHFKFPKPGHVDFSHSKIQCQDVTFGYSKDKILFSHLNFHLDQDSRIALVGPNGAGKSTILKLLNGEISPIAGAVAKSGKLKLGTFSQHHVDILDVAMTPLEALKYHYPRVDLQELRGHLGRMGLSGEIVMRPIATLSGGQKSRVSFAVITWPRPHILLLDEPTNHLDMETIDALIDALNDYAGGIVMVSHDERIISAVCDELWVCEDSHVTAFDGDFDAYKEVTKKRMNL